MQRGIEVCSKVPCIQDNIQSSLDNFPPYLRQPNPGGSRGGKEEAFVRGNFSSIGANMKKTTDEVKTAATLSTSRIASELSDNDGFQDGAEGTVEGLKVLAAAASVASSRLVDETKKTLDKFN